MILQSALCGRRVMHIIVFPSLHHLCHLWEQYEPVSEGLGERSRKQRHCWWFLTIIQVVNWGETELGPVMYMWWRPGKDQSLPAGLVETSVRGEHFSCPCSSLWVTFRQPGCEGHFSFLATLGICS